MRLDKKHYPPIGLLEGGNIRLDIQDSMSSIWKNSDVSKKVIYDLILEGKNNIMTSTEEARQFMSKHSERCVDAYMKDNNKKAFGGAFIEMDLPFPSIDFYTFNPMKRKKLASEKNEEVIVCTFMSVQGMKNTVISFGKIVLTNYSCAKFDIETDFVCINEKEEDLTIKYMLYLLELNSFLVYGQKSDKNLLDIAGNQKVILPGGRVIDNRSGNLIKCLLPPNELKIK